MLSKKFLNKRQLTVFFTFGILYIIMMAVIDYNKMTPIENSLYVSIRTVLSLAVALSYWIVIYDIYLKVFYLKNEKFTFGFYAALIICILFVVIFRESINKAIFLTYFIATPFIILLVFFIKFMIVKRM
ncbi:MAG: hypothetical protein CVV21_01890 [Candidatus Goldiibacteriota bacterium HGW-Goldbacteria-1]|jgi:hypothetical protein|nr:MAG: hypothetical protein CVV21_01890 [Candidatus Goldiibacteriota bacterium HGW-Goldbacteria-1]